MEISLKGWCDLKQILQIQLLVISYLVISCYLWKTVYHYLSHLNFTAIREMEEWLRSSLWIWIPPRYQGAVCFYRVFGLWCSRRAVLVGILWPILEKKRCSFSNRALTWRIMWREVCVCGGGDTRRFRSVSDAEWHSELLHSSQCKARELLFPPFPGSLSL